MKQDLTGVKTRCLMRGAHCRPIRAMRDQTVASQSDPLSTIFVRMFEQPVHGSLSFRPWFSGQPFVTRFSVRC